MAKYKAKKPVKATKPDIGHPGTKSSSTGPRYPPLEADPNPPKLFIFPENRSKESQFVDLLNPATSAPSRYFHCPQEGLFEVKEISYPRSQPRSWLIESLPAPPVAAGSTPEPSTKDGERCTSSLTREGVVPPPEAQTGWVLERPSFYMTTPIDPLFLLIPVLVPPKSLSTRRTEDSFGSSHFLTLDDHFDSVTAQNPDYKLLLQPSTTRATLHKRATALSDDVEVGNERLYRMSTEKLAKELLAKARRMFATTGKLPPSLEERFVRRPLESSMLADRDTNSTSRPPVGDSHDEKENVYPIRPVLKAQESSISSSAVLSAEASKLTSMTDITIPTLPDLDLLTSEDEPTAEIADLLRLRTALTFLLHSYIPPSLHLTLQGHFSNLVSFTPLESHLSRLAELRKESAAMQAINNDSVFVQKRSWSNDDGEGSFESRAEKKRKLEKEGKEEERKKGSKGLRELKKVDTSGMKKMSSFFVKKN